MTWADIKNRVYFLTRTSSTSFTDANLTLAIQRATERAVSLINKSDMRWQWDDSNQTDLPSGTTAIVSGQQDYSLATSHLTIDRVELKDSSGNWTLLTPIDQHDKTKDAMMALATSGLPTEYDKVGNSILLYPKPNYSQTASLKIYFTRGPLNFSYVTGQFTDGTGSTSSTPGFNSLFHDLIPLWASYDYALAYGLNNANQIMAEILRKEQELYDFYGQRARDERPRMTAGAQDNR